MGGMSVSVVRRVIALHYEVELQLQPGCNSLNHLVIASGLLYEV